MSLVPAATSWQARRNAVEPEAEAFSTCSMGMPVTPRCLYSGRPGAMPSIAVPV